MVGNIALVVVAALSAWLVLSVLVGMAIGACLRPRTRVVSDSARRDPGIRQPARAA